VSRGGDRSDLDDFSPFYWLNCPLPTTVSYERPILLAREPDATPEEVGMPVPTVACLTYPTTDLIHPSTDPMPVAEMRIGGLVL